MAVCDQVEAGVEEWDRRAGRHDDLDTEWLQHPPGDRNVGRIRLDRRHQLLAAERSDPFGHPLAPARLDVQNRVTLYPGGAYELVQNPTMVVGRFDPSTFQIREVPSLERLGVLRPQPFEEIIVASRTVRRLLAHHEVVAKSAASKTAEIDAHMARLEHPLKAEVQAVREIIKSVNPGITEQIKWNAPSFSYRGQYPVTLTCARPIGCIWSGTIRRLRASRASCWKVTIKTGV